MGPGGVVWDGELGLGGKWGWLIEGRTENVGLVKLVWG